MRVSSAFVLLVCLATTAHGISLLITDPEAAYDGDSEYVANHVTRSVTSNTFLASLDLTDAHSVRGEWAVRVHSDSVDVYTLAGELGLVVIRRIANLPNMYLLAYPDTTLYTSGVGSEGSEGSEWAGESDVVVRDDEPAAAELVVRFADTTAKLDDHPHVHWHEQQVARNRYVRTLPEPEDPLYHDQWHLNNTGQNNAQEYVDVNIFPAWAAGYTGAGVTICVVDDGIDHAHPDLAPNYNADASYDFNYHDSDPQADKSFDKHGTSASGAAAARDESTCGVGTAPHAGLSCTRIISKAATDAEEADALNYANTVNDIYSNSWGPSDNGKTVSGPGPLLTETFAQATRVNRGGKGSIYMWAGGNGARSDDNCNYDGYANSIYTVSIGAVTDMAQRASYSEPCAALLAVAPSSGGKAGIVTTDRMGSAGYSPNDCNTGFGGTSAACPITAGVVALMLEANPELGWRDVQYIIKETATMIDPKSSGWRTNGAGTLVNDEYGYGLIDAAAAVKAASTWTNVPPMASVIGETIAIGSDIPNNDADGVEVGTTLSGLSLRVEFVEVTLTIKHNNRGDLRIEITSPAGTVSRLADARADSGNDYTWTFMSVQFWGEESGGKWMVKVTDLQGAQSGTWIDMAVSVHGVACADLPPSECPIGCDGSGGFSDECGICGGDGSTCNGCNGLPMDAGGEVFDDCGVCGGTNACIDVCGVYYGDNSTCTDICGVVNGDGSTCMGCDGVPIPLGGKTDCGSEHVASGSGGVEAGEQKFDWTSMKMMTIYGLVGVSVIGGVILVVLLSKRRSVLATTVPGEADDGEAGEAFLASFSVSISDEGAMDNKVIPSPGIVTRSEAEVAVVVESEDSDASEGSGVSGGE